MLARMKKLLRGLGFQDSGSRNKEPSLTNEGGWDAKRPTNENGGGSGFKFPHPEP